MKCSLLPKYTNSFCLVLLILTIKILVRSLMAATLAPMVVQKPGRPMVKSMALIDFTIAKATFAIESAKNPFILPENDFLPQIPFTFNGNAYPIAALSKGP